MARRGLIKAVPRVGDVEPGSTALRRIDGELRRSIAGSRCRKKPGCRAWTLRKRVQLFGCHTGHWRGCASLSLRSVIGVRALPKITAFEIRVWQTLKSRGAVQQLRGFDPLQGGVVVRRHQSSHYQTQRLLVFSQRLGDQADHSERVVRGEHTRLVILSGESIVIPLFFSWVGLLVFPDLCAALPLHQFGSRDRVRGRDSVGSRSMQCGSHPRLPVHRRSICSIHQAHRAEGHLARESLWPRSKNRAKSA